MCRRLARATCVWLWLAAIPTAARAGEKDPFADLPAGWKVVSSFVAPKAQTQAIGGKLAGRAKKVKNTPPLAAPPGRAPVNIFAIRRYSNSDGRTRASSGQVSTPAKWAAFGGALPQKEPCATGTINPLRPGRNDVRTAPRAENPACLTLSPLD